MDQIVIDGVRGYDGRYDFDIGSSPLTTREWGWIKRLAGYLPTNVDEGFSDPELIIVFALIALRRAGRVEDRDVSDVFGTLSDAPFGAQIRFEIDQTTGQEEAGPGPPPSSSTSSGDTAGPDSRTSSEISLVHPQPSGTPGSDTPESAQARSAS